MIKIPLAALALACSAAIAILLPPPVMAQAAQSKPTAPVPPVSLPPAPPKIAVPSLPPISVQSWEKREADRKKYEQERAEEKKRRDARKAAYDYKPDPALWVIRQGDSKIYLFGMLDHSNYRIAWKGDRLESVIAEADAAYFSKAFIGRDDRTEEKRIARRAMHLLIRDDREPFDQRIDPQYQDAILESREMAIYGFGDFMPTWTVLAMLANKEREFFNSRSRNRIERDLARAFEKRGIRIQGLEAAERPIEILNSIDEKSQRTWLNTYLANASKPELQASLSQDEGPVLNGLEKQQIAWAKGERYDLPERYPPGLNALYAHLEDSQLSNWTQFIADMARKGGTVFIALDHHYLLGDNSLRDRLKAKGLKVKRLK